ncbi:MAG: ASKHA domain-containing protein, partial [Prevotellaceae bacterium]|nr:ASKHA domain-containing protein [Prevotellaceae bacterium]
MPEQATIQLQPAGLTLTANVGAPLKDVLHGYGVEFPCGGIGLCTACKVRLLSGALTLSAEHAQSLRKRNLSGAWRLACMSTVEGDMALEVGQWERFILTDSTSFAFTPQDGHGVAVDLGSTTIVSQLIDLRRGSIVAVQQGANPQADYGADIMSRIAFAQGDGSSAALLTSLTRRAVGEQVQRLVASAQATPKRVVVVGNTAMHHLFCGLDVAPLAAFPFLTPQLDEVQLAPRQLGWALPPEVRVAFAPCLGGFVGSDVLAGIIAARMHEKEAYSVLIDLGTNGEIVVGNRHGLLCASTAAGPAFEGSAISCGMCAATGACASLPRPPPAQGLQAHVLGGVPPRGICGSGLIDALALLSASGDIEPTGALRGELPALPLTEGVSLSQRDVRELQLAKAAIATGVELLMGQLGIGRRSVEKVY